MNNCIYIKENAVSDKNCDTLIDSFHKNSWLHTSGTINDGDEDASKKASTDAGLSFDDYIEDELPFIKALQKSLDAWVEDCPGLYEQDSFGICSRHNLQWYKPGEGYHQPHCEWSVVNEGTIKRMAAWMFYLNDVEEGGGTEFPHQEFIAQPKRGTLVCFPAQWTHYHKGIVAPKEDKYILTGWFMAQ